jgi:hypothetical protein
MRLLSSFMRLAVTAGSLVAPWLAVAAPVEASQRPVTVKHERRVVCDPRVPPRRLLQQVAHAADSTPRVLRTVTARLQRASLTPEDDDDAAIQNDAPVARFDVAREVAPLEPLGVLTSSGFSRPNHRTFSPRSPRGPPVSSTLS